MKHIKTLLGDSMIYGVSGILTRMIGVFLIPLYTRLFKPEDYGIINLVNTTFFLLGILVVCALDNAAGRWFYDSRESEDQKKTFGTWIWWQFILSAAVAILIICFSAQLAKLFFGAQGKAIYFIIPAAGLISTILPAVINNWYRVHRRAVATVVFGFCQTMLTIGLTVLFVLILKWGITGVFAATTISSAIFSLIALQQMRLWISPSFFERQRLKNMLRYALPFIPAALAYWLLNSTDSYFLAYFKNKAEVGLFGIGAALAAGISLFTGAFQQAWGPFAFSIMDEPEAREVYANVFLIFTYAMGLLAAALMIFAPEVLRLLTAPAYWSAAWVAGILGFNLVFIGFTYVASIGISIAKVTSPYGYAMLAATVVTILLDILLIPKFGKEGSALATLAAQVLVPAYLFYRGNKVYPIPYRFTEAAIVIILCGLLSAAVRFLTVPGTFSGWIIKTGVLLLMCAAAFLMNKTKLSFALNKVRRR